MALAESVQYALNSSFLNLSCKKTVIFVKLTDSAFRAIGTYYQLQQKTGQHAKIQFLGDKGHIQIPASHASGGHLSFDFDLSSNSDIEGPQGSFECIQQCGPKLLQSMGPLPFKMRIRANDDVYAKARENFSYIEQSQRESGAKEIEQPSAENGRKAKKKFGGGQLVHRGRETSPMRNSYSPSKTSLSLSNSKSHVVSSQGTKLHGVTHGSRSNSSNRPVKNIGSRALNGPHLDIMKRPLRERLIHMLAVKPMKKPELLNKIMREGLKDKDRKMLMHVLQQVSQLKDNEYNLSRGIWNDIQDDWPFYTEEERQIMRRRKPQNLTPPGSDCSVGSGSSGSSSSPRSTSFSSGNSPTLSRSNPCDYGSSYGSAAKFSSNYSSSSNKGSLLPERSAMHSQGTKRGPNFFDSNNNDDLLMDDGSPTDNIPTKKQRVSQFKKPNCSNKDNFISANSSRSESNREPPRVKDSMPSVGSGTCAPTSSSGRDKSHLHPNVMGTSCFPESLSPSTSTDMGTNHRSPRTLKDHRNYSPTYSSTSTSHSQNSKLSYHGNNQLNSGQVNHHGEDFGYSTSSSSAGNIGNDSRTSNTSGNRTSQIGHSQSSAIVNKHVDRDFDLDLSLPDSHDTDNANDCGQSVVSFDSSVVLNHNRENQSPDRANLNVSKVFSSSSSVASSYGNSKEFYTSGKDGDIRSMKRESDVPISSSSASRGGNRVSSSSSYKQPSSKDSPYVSNSSPGSQNELLRNNTGASARNESGKDRTDRVKDERSADSSEKKHGDRISCSSSLKSRVGDENCTNSREKHRDRIQADCFKEKSDRDHEKLAKPDNSYLAQYTTIRNREQRNRYKADFNAEYDEYRDLHAVIDKVSKKFAQLAERLHKEEKGSPAYQLIREEIIREYEYNKNSKKYTDAKEKFSRLHEKLSHIKKLVAEYDTLNSADAALADDDDDY